MLEAGIVRRLAQGFILAVSACVALAACGCDAQPQSADGVTGTRTPGAESTPKAEDELRQMADYLGKLPAFSCRVESVMQIQAKDMDNRMETTMNVRLERPNRVALVVDQGVMGTTIVSDGQQLIQFLPMMNRYTVSEAPEDLASLMETADAISLDRLPIMIIASGDGFYEMLAEGVNKSEYVDKEKIGEVMCHHYRFDKEDIVWDVWIEAGDRPLIHKVVSDMSKRMAKEGVSGKLEYSIGFSNWNVSPTFTETDFVFTPPESAEKVDSLREGLAGGPEEPHPLLGQPAPAFQTVDPDGQPIDLSAHLGKNVIMLDFWATWCGPCIEAMPIVEGVAEKFADQGLVFYAVNGGEDAETVKQFLASNKLELPVAMDLDGAISGLYLVNGIPQTVLIGKDGKVQVVHVGFGGNLGELLTQQVEDLLAGKDLASEAQAEATEARDEADEPPADPEAVEVEATQPADEGENAADVANGEDET